MGRAEAMRSFFDEIKAMGAWFIETARVAVFRFREAVDLVTIRLQVTGGSLNVFLKLRFLYHGNTETVTPNPT